MNKSVEVEDYISVEVIYRVDRKEPTALFSLFHVGKDVGCYGTFKA